MHRNSDNALCCEAWPRNARKRKDNGHNGNNATTPNQRKTRKKDSRDNTTW